MSQRPRGHPTGADLDAEVLLQGLPWGMVVLNAPGPGLRLHQQAARWWGVSPLALRGQRLGLATVGAANRH